MRKIEGGCLQLYNRFLQTLWVIPKATVAARKERRMFTLWTLYQALKLLERHAILNQRCENWVEVIITSRLIMGFQKQSGGVGQTSPHPLVLTFKFSICP